MNSEKLRNVAQLIESESSDVAFEKKAKYRFAMEAFWQFDSQYCKTVCCIAGSTVLLQAKDDPELLKRIENATDLPKSQIVSKTAQEFLDLQNAEARALFVPNAFQVKQSSRKNRTVYIDTLKKKHAVFVLREIADCQERIGNNYVGKSIIEDAWKRAFIKLGD